jgi:hypothetical protein
VAAGRVDHAPAAQQQIEVLVHAVFPSRNPVVSMLTTQE